MVRREKFGEVIRLLQWMTEQNLKEQGIQAQDEVWTDSKGNTHIRRPAQNDNWY
jgi:hypothetical protein